MALKKRFWQISPGRKEQKLWPEFSKIDVIAIGWDDLGDLTKYSNIDELQEEIRRRWNGGINSARSCWYFSREIKKNDIIVAKYGASKEIYGIGKVTEEYNFNDEREFFKHVIGVHWYIKFDDSVKVDTSKKFVQWAVHSLSEERYSEIKNSILRNYPDQENNFLMMETREGERPEILHLLYKIAWHPRGYKGGFCGEAESKACEAFNYIRTNKKKQRCSPGVFHCVDEHEAFADDGWKVKIHPPYYKRLHQLSDGKSLAFLVAPQDVYKKQYRLVGFYTIKRTIIENGKVTGLEADKNESSKFDFENPDLLYASEELVQLFEMERWTPRTSYEFISSETARKVLNEVNEKHKNKEIVDPDVNLKAIRNAIENLRTRVPEVSIKDILEELIENEPEYSEVIKAAFAHLVAGKNLVIYGPPATSKTYLAKRICEYACEAGDFSFHTANAEWSYFDIVGGLIPKGDQTIFKEGILLEATEKCKKSVDAGKKPCWLIIDELNRANLDLAFGKIFTQLDLDYRDRALHTAEKDGKPYGYFMPFSFRILATMNTYDRALLFSLGYAFMRRFAFIPLESLLKEKKSMETEAEMQLAEDMKAVLESETIKRLKEKTKQVVFNHFSKTDVSDKAFIYGELEIKDKNDIDKVIADLKIQDLDILDVLLYVSNKITNEGLVEIGHAIVFDAAKFIVAYSLLFPQEKDPRSLLDEVVVSYLLPQLEYFMPKLRKGRIFEEEKYTVSWERLTQTILNLNLPKTSRKLKEAEEEFKVIR